MGSLYENYDGPRETWSAPRYDTLLRLTTQTFITTSAHDIGAVRLWVYRDLSTGTVTISLKATDGSGKPTGADLATGTIAESSIPVGTINATWVECAFASAYAVSDSTKYAIVITNLSAESIFVGRSTLNGGDSGQIGLSVNGGSTWSMYDTPDLMYRIYNAPWVFTPPADVATVKRLAAAANNKFWYEAI